MEEILSILVDKTGDVEPVRVPVGAFRGRAFVTRYAYVGALDESPPSWVTLARYPYAPPTESASREPRPKKLSSRKRK